MRNNTKNRFISGLLAGVMMLNQVPVFASAEETGLCEHHTVHEDCGYVESVISCGFKCDVCIQKQGETTTPTVDASMPINGTDESELLMQEQQKETPPEEISIPETLCIGVNQVNTIRPEFTPLNATTVLRCESSNPEIVSCHLAGIGYSVNVTGKSPGTGIITIYTDNGKSASCSVTVLATGEPTEISIPQYCQLQVGQSYHIPITLLPVDAETLYSVYCSNYDIVSVNTTGSNSGVVIYGANEGVAVITVETSNGLQATCEVTVESGDEVEQVIIPGSKQLVEADTWYVPITNYPETSYTRYSISCDNSSVVRVGTTGASTGCFVQAVSEGTATITISTDNGKYASCLITVVHDFSEEIVYVDPTCTNSGGLAKKCTICGKLIITEEYQEAFGHSEEIDAAVDATCTEPGLTEGRHCSECGEVLLAQKVIPAGHKVTDGICTMCRSYGTNGTDVTWEYQDGILTISGSGQMNSFDVIAEYPWCDIHDLVHTVIIEEGITNIPKSAFHLFQNLTSIYIPDSVTSIGETAFVYCKSLTQIQIPDSVETIGSRAFDGCTALEGVKLPAKLKTVSSELFYNCNALAYAVIPNGVTTIESGAFSRCFSLDYLYLPASVTSIAGNNSNYANNTRVFDSCSENLVILCQNSAKPNGWSRYWNYISATNALQVYYGCTSQDGDFWVLGDKTNTSLRIPEGVTVVPAKAFYDRGDLTAVFLPDSLTTIGHSAFRDCENLEEIQIPQGVKTIESNTFHSCVNLQHVVIPDSLITIEKSAFKNCKALAWIYIPANVYQIEESPFYGCDSSMNIYCGAEEKSIAWSEKWNYYQDYTPTLRTHFGYSREEASYWANLDVSQNKIEIPEGITRIPDSAFYGCSNIESITIPNSVISVGEYAFSGCTGLTSIQLPASISYIGRYAFNGCTDLYQINIPQALVDLNECVFAGCTALEEIIFPDTLETIRKHVFYNCTGLGKFTFLGDAPYIHEKAFYGVTATAYYPDSNPTWTSDMLQNNGGTITWLTYGDEHTHNYVDDVCTICGELHPRYVSLDSVEWTAKQVINGTLYQMTLNFGEAGLGITYGDNIDQFDAELRETLLQEYYKGSPAVVLVDGAYFYVGRGDGGNITYTTNGKNVYVNCEDYINLTFKRTSEKQLTVVDSNLENLIGLILTCCEEPSIDDEHTHNYVDDVCTICGELHPRYVSLDSVEWTAKQVINGTLYQMTLNFGEAGLGITYGDNIDQFDAELRETLLQEYYKGSPAVVLVDGAYFYVGRGDGGNITYTTNGKNVYVNCEDYIDLTFKRTGEKQLTVVGSNLENLIGLVLTCCGDSTIGHEWQEATCATPKVCTICGITEGVATGNHTFDESTHQCACGAYGGKCGDDVTWMLDTEGVLTLSGTGATYDYSGITNQVYAPWNNWREQISSLVIGEEIFGIGKEVFYNLPALREIRIPAGVQSIGARAFAGCHNLKAITVDEENAYYTSVDGVLFDKDQSILLSMPAGYNGNYTVPDGITTIDNSAFMYCMGVTNVVFPESLEAIGESAFYNCHGLTELQLPEGVTVIGRMAFDYCVNLKEINIPKSVTKLSSGVFRQTGIENVALHEGIVEIADAAFWKSNLKEIVIPGSVENIGSSAFSLCKNLETVVISEGVEIIDGTAFEECSALRSIVLPQSLKTIEGHAFRFCSSLTEVDIPAAVVSIGYNAFSGCSALSAITLHRGLQRIEYGAFEGTAVEKITIPATVTCIEWLAFADCDNLTEITFCGNAPFFDTHENEWNMFQNVTATAYYPINDSTWTSDVKQNYGGTITWICNGCQDGHTEVIDEAVPPDCENTGLTEGKHCSFCDKVIVAQEVIPAKGHTEVIDKAAEAGCEDTGLTEGKHCSICGKVIIAQEVIPAKGHTEVIDKAAEAGCEDTGLTEGKHCSICGKVIVAQEVIPANGHTEVVDKAAEAGCEDTGLTEGKHCSVCDKVIVAQEVIPAKGHTEVIDKAVEPTCTETGLTEGKHCSVCRTITMKQENIDALGCSFTVYESNEDATCVADGTKTANCDRGCGATDVIIAEGTLNPDAHGFSEWVITGNKSQRVCSLCGYTENKLSTDSGDVEIESPEQPGLDFEVDPVEPTENKYILVEKALNNVDNMEYAILKVFDITLENADGVHVQPSGTVKVKLPLDWEKDGNYKVYRVNDDGTLTDMQAYRQGSYMVFETDHFSLYVIVEEAHSEEVHKHNYHAVVTAPDCTKEGFTTYTCDCGDSYTDEVVPANGHKEVIDRNEKATCGKTGLTEGKHCSVCKKVLVKQEVIPATGKHTGGTATCTKKAVCKVCGQPYGKLNSRNHSFTKYVSDQNATCKKNGTKTAKCDYGCGKTDTVTDRDSKLGHKYQGDKCIRCGVTKWNPDTGDKIMIAITVLIVSGSSLLVLLFLKKRK